MDEAKSLRAIVDSGKDAAALAAILGISPSTIHHRMRLLKLIPQVQEAFRQNKILYCHAFEICQLPSESQWQAYALVKEGRRLLSWREFRRKIKFLRR